MNVKEGDIARVVGLPLNQMALLRVIRALLPGEDSDVYRPAWVCEALSPCHGDGSNAGKIGMPGDEILAYDGCLRPLYDGDAQDEVLRLVGLPNQPEKVHLPIDLPL